MTTKKTAVQKPAARRTPVAAEKPMAKTFERAAPSSPQMRLSKLPSPSGRGGGGEGELPVDPDSENSVVAGSEPVNARDLILRLVETLKGL
jgi:hypothetical protein